MTHYKNKYYFNLLSFEKKIRRGGMYEYSERLIETLENKTLQEQNRIVKNYIRRAISYSNGVYKKNQDICTDYPDNGEVDLELFINNLNYYSDRMSIRAAVWLSRLWKDYRKNVM